MTANWARQRAEWDPAFKKALNRPTEGCWNCGGTTLQNAGQDLLGAAITTCADCGERQEDV